MNKDSTTNKSLNSFRAIAFFVVFLFHINLLDCGYLGVQAFFCIVWVFNYSHFSRNEI